MVDEIWDARPKKLVVDGQEREFFEIHALAAALGKSPVTIRLWMRNRIMPEARYRQRVVGAKGDRRLWTREEIEFIVRVAEEEGLLRKSKVKDFKDHSAFTRRLFDFFTAN